MTVHHIHIGIPTLSHTWCDVSVIKKAIWFINILQRFSEGVASEGLQRLTETRETETSKKVAKWVGLVVVGSSGNGSRAVR